MACKKKWKYIKDFGGKLEGKNNLEDVGIYGTITLQSMLEKQDGKAQIAFMRLRIEKWQTLANTIVKLLVLQNLGSFLTNCENNSFSRGSLLNGVISDNGMTFELTEFLHHMY